MPGFIRSTAIALFTALALGCGSGASNPVTIQSPETIVYDGSLGIDLSTMTRSADGLYARDLIVGTGTQAVNGKTLGIHYTAYLNNGIVFDANDPGTTFSFVLGSKQVIAGLEEGIPGMLVGGRRVFVIPPALAYGNTAVGDLPAGSVVIFAVDLITVQ